jgi:hypothetical protein
VSSHQADGRELLEGHATGSGHTLDPAARERLAPHVGDPLTDARIHTDTAAFGTCADFASCCCSTSRSAGSTSVAASGSASACATASATARRSS